MSHTICCTAPEQQRFVKDPTLVKKSLVTQSVDQEQSSRSIHLNMEVERRTIFAIKYVILKDTSDIYIFFQSDFLLGPRTHSKALHTPRELKDPHYHHIGRFWVACSFLRERFRAKFTESNVGSTGTGRPQRLFLGGFGEVLD